MRYQSAAMVGDIPVVSIAFGPDSQTQQARGRAMGVIAVGDVAAVSYTHLTLPTTPYV